MHEVSAIKGILEIIKEKAAEGNFKKVTKLNISLGKGSGVTKEEFAYWFKELSKDTSACGAKLSFNEPLDPNIYLESIEAE